MSIFLHLKNMSDVPGNYGIRAAYLELTQIFS